LSGKLRPAFLSLVLPTTFDHEPFARAVRRWLAKYT
jgi:hypothetical protein